MISNKTHMEHLEDLVLNNGIKGANDALNFLEALKDSLTSSSKDAVNALIGSKSPQNQVDRIAINICGVEKLV